jgi:hypothetical protein
MPASTNFKRWNEALANLESDATYLADAMRTGGAASGVFPSALFNKFALQAANLCAALAAMMVAKGYTVEDGSAGTTGHDFTALQAALSNIMTAIDITNMKGAANGIAALDSNSKVSQDPASKGSANGVAGLDSNGIVPAAELGSGSADNTKVLCGDRTWKSPGSVGPTISTSGYTNILAGGNLIMGQGIYNAVDVTVASGGNTGIVFEIYQGGAWRTPGIQGYGFALNGAFFCDGSNMRFRNLDAIPHTLYWQRF